VMREVPLYVNETYPTHVGGVHVLHGSGEIVQHLVYGKRAMSRSASDADARIPDKVTSKTS